MATTKEEERQIDDPVGLRTDCLRRLSDLVNSVKGWAKDLDWSTRQIGKTMKDSRLGCSEAPAQFIMMTSPASTTDAWRRLRKYLACLPDERIN